MPAERVPMRGVREIMRLKHGCGATDRMIARSTCLNCCLSVGNPDIIF
jgi:hypothetical protein